MKKIFGLILSAAVLGTVLTACGGSGAGVSFSGAAGASEPASASGSAVNSSVYGTTLADIQAKGELVIGLDDTFAPMGFRDESGNLVGFDIDLATAVCEELGGMRRKWSFLPEISIASGMECPSRRNVRKR